MPLLPVAHADSYAQAAPAIADANMDTNAYSIFLPYTDSHPIGYSNLNSLTFPKSISDSPAAPNASAHCDAHTAAHRNACAKHDSQPHTQPHP